MTITCIYIYNNRIINFTIITTIKKIRILGFSEDEVNTFIMFANDLDNVLTIGDILCLLNPSNLF